MIVTLFNEFRFEASHRLDHLPDDHPCFNLHGHSYGVRVEVRGEVDEKIGFLMDYAKIAEIVKPLIDQMDHSHLNDIADLPLATTEYISRWLWQRIKPKLPELYSITVSETTSTGCVYRGE